jgi:hypothetical protein
MNKSSYFESVIDSIELLDPEDQKLVIEIIKKRLAEKRRQEITNNIEQARIDYKQGNIKRGTVKELFDEVDSSFCFVLYYLFINLQNKCEAFNFKHKVCEWRYLLSVDLSKC